MLGRPVATVRQRCEVMSKRERTRGAAVLTAAMISGEAIFGAGCGSDPMRQSRRSSSTALDPSAFAEDRGKPRCADRSHLAHFFPPGTSLGSAEPAWLQPNRTNENEEFLRGWYSRILLTMNEPSLSCGGSSSQQYRFLMVPSWGRPTAVRVAISGSAATIDVVALSVANNREVGPIAVAKERALSSQETASLLDILEQAHFWSTATRDERLGTDGSRWVVEGRLGATYHVVDRWSPDQGPFHRLCSTFAHLGGVRAN
jgi:hypothetical protein